MAAAQVLLPGIRRVHHVERIVVRNLESEDGPLDCLFTLATRKNGVFYESAVDRQTLNPQWEFVRPSDFVAPVSPLSADVTVVVYAVGERGEREELVREEVELEELQYFKSVTGFRGSDLLPSNAVLFFLTDGVYVSPRVHDVVEREREKRRAGSAAAWRKARAHRQKRTGKGPKLSADAIVQHATELLRKQARARDLLREKELVAAEIAKGTRHYAEGAQQVQAVKARAGRVQELERQLEIENAALKVDRERIAELRRALVPEAQQLRALNTGLKQHEEQQTGARAAEVRLSGARAELVAVSRKLRARQRKLVSELVRLIYPIEASGEAKSSSSTVTWTIRGVPLPPSKSLAAQDDELVSTALGYVAHALILISKYMDVPLRYRLVYRGSRSSVCDDVQSFQEFPLYMRGVDERRFQCGFVLLNRNLHHLLAVFDVAAHRKVRPSAHTLENLHALVDVLLVV